MRFSHDCFDIAVDKMTLTATNDKYMNLSWLDRDERIDRSEI